MEISLTFLACMETFEELGESVDFSGHYSHFDDFKNNFEERFQDFVKLQPSMLLFCDPRTVDVSTVESCYQMELCDLQADPFLKQRPETGAEPFRLLSSDRFPLLRKFGLRMFSMFGSTYRCEQAFSNVNVIKSKFRSHLSDSSLESSLRLATSNFSADIDELMKESQAQVSH